jgi:ParB family chromosome partitioning protein
VAKGMSVRQVEKYVSDEKNGRFTRTPEGNPSNLRNKPKDADIIALEETLSENLGLKVGINDRGSAGEIVITYTSLEQLDEVLKRLGGSA